MCATVISTLTLIYTVRRFNSDSTVRDANRVAEQTEQKIRLDNISAQLSEVLKQVSAINIKQSDQTVTIAQMNERMSTIFRRVERLEGVLDAKWHDEIGGTD